MTSAPALARVGIPHRKHRRRWDASAAAFAGPALILALVFLVLPLLGAFVFSTAEIAPLSGKITWVGLDNYASMISDPTFYRALVNTAVFIGLTVPGSMAIGLALAVLMNSVLPARKVFRTIIYLPLVISGVAVGLIGTFLFNETIGVLDNISESLGLPSVAWQSNGASAFASVVLMTLWIRVGFTMIIYLAGLQSGRSSCRSRLRLKERMPGSDSVSSRYRCSDRPPSSCW